VKFVFQVYIIFIERLWELNWKISGDSQISLSIHKFSLIQSDRKNPNAEGLFRSPTDLKGLSAMLSKRQFLFPTLLRADSKLHSLLCKTPCEGASQYLYSNQSCLDSWPAPFQIKSDPGVNFCKNLCSSNMQFYLYNNGSCHPACPWPLRGKVENGVKCCLRPCQSAREYILKDDSCSAECPAPMVRRMIEPSIGTYCLNPCESPDHFLTKVNNGSLFCLLNCPESFERKIEDGFEYCVNPCSPQQ